MTASDHRGVLYPARLPTFARYPAEEAVAAFVRWFWIPEWQIAAGRTSRQHVIAFPACNLVVERAVVGLAGPTTRCSARDLRGTGWAVGALLRPAAVPFFERDPARLRDGYRVLELPELRIPVVTAMDGPGGAGQRHRGAIEAFGDWILATLPAPDRSAMLANALAELVDTDPEVVRVEDISARLHVSIRTVQRLARRYVGLTPLTMIRRRRVQEAAQRLRTEPGLGLAEIAAQYGYADQAHLATEFRTILGFTPTAYRAGSGGPARGSAGRPGDSSAGGPVRGSAGGPARG